MRRFELINDGGMADIHSVCVFARVTPEQIKAWARRQWRNNDPDRSLPVACDRTSHRLVYDVAAANRLAVAFRRHAA